MDMHCIFLIIAVSTLTACVGSDSSTPSNNNLPNTAPTNVRLLEVSSASAGAMSISWLPASDDKTQASAMKYQVHASTSANFTSSAQTLKFEGVGVTSAVINSGINPGANYTVRLVAIDEQGASTTSDSLQVTILNKLPDTGITSAQCYQAGSDVLVSCTSPLAIALNDKQDGMLGRDVSNPDNADGKLGFSYSLVGNYAKTECVKDNITGLMWEGKPTSGVRAATNAYTNYGDKRSGDATAYVDAVNATVLCGYSDWRLPTADELQSLVDYGVASPGPTIDTSWFPNTQNISYWSSSPIMASARDGWVVNFGVGFVYDYTRYSILHVRLVR